MIPDIIGREIRSGRFQRMLRWKITAMNSRAMARGSRNVTRRVGAENAVISSLSRDSEPGSCRDQGAYAYQQAQNHADDHR